MLFKNIKQSHKVSLMSHSRSMLKGFSDNIGRS